MKILTERLELRPLTSAQLALYINDSEKLTQELGLKVPLEPLSEHMKKVYRLKVSRIEAEPASLLYNTYFIIILKEAKCMIGSLGLKGSPDNEGLIEVGYSIEPEYQCRGYMREALQSFLDWVMQLKEVSGVNACTSKTNIPSHKVLRACGFDCIYIDKDMFVWRYVSL